MRVGFIGLGRMGKGMAHRILSGGHDLAVYDVAPQATIELAKGGAHVASSVEDLCEDREVVITMLAEDSAVNEVALIASSRRDSYRVGHIWDCNHPRARSGTRESEANSRCRSSSWKA
jgi:3-hydroxyisobutyrate dehydrogenase